MTRATERVCLSIAVGLAICQSAAAAPIIWGNSAGGTVAQGFVWLDAFDMDPAIGAPDRVAAILAPTPGVDFPNGRGIVVVGDLIDYSRAFTFSEPNGGQIYNGRLAHNGDGPHVPLM